MHYQDSTLEGLLKEIASYNPDSDTELIKKAFEYAKEKTHSLNEKDIDRPLLNHLLNTAQIAAQLMLDDETIVAALIHDIPFNDKETHAEIEKNFGKEITGIVDELVKIVEIEGKNIDTLDANLLSMVVLAASKDIRSIFLRIATRTERLRIIKKYPKEKQLKTANNTLKIYAPLSHKLGLDKIHWELEDLCLKITNPATYNIIKTKMCVKREVREKEIETIKQEISELLRKNDFSTTVQARAKNFTAIQKKLQVGKSFAEINDLRGIRIICNSIKDCYEILGLIHSNYLPIPKEFRDYIANPKPNGYKSLHTCIYWSRKQVEIQIRTWEMHHEAETGVSAHWQYKKYEQAKTFDKKLSWAKQLVDWKQIYPNAKDFLKSLKIDFDKHQIFVFTPKKQVVMLPDPSTPLDFAFALHTDLGLKCKQAKINGSIAPLDHTLENGDTVEIITDKNSTPKRQWLSFVHSPKAKSKIKKILGIHSTPTGTEKPSTKKNIKTENNATIKIANCCNPLPGDEIIGYKTTKRKISVHRKECPNTTFYTKQRCIEIEWSDHREQYQTAISINATDRAGLLNDILNKLAESKAEINTTQVKINKNNTANCEFSIKVRNQEQLEKILKEIERIPSIYSVSRK